MAAFIITGDENVTSFLKICSVTIPPLITDGFIYSVSPVSDNCLSAGAIGWRGFIQIIDTRLLSLFYFT